MPLVEASVRRSNKYALRVIDIKKWGTPVADQYRIRSIPHFILFDPSGKEIDRGLDSVMGQVVDGKGAAPASRSAVPRRILAVAVFFLGLGLLKSQ